MNDDRKLAEAKRLFDLIKQRSEDWTLPGPENTDPVTAANTMKGRLQNVNKDAKEGLELLKDVEASEKPDMLTARHIVASMRQMMGKEYRAFEHVLTSLPAVVQRDILRLLRDVESEFHNIKSRARRDAMMGKF